MAVWLYKAISTQGKIVEGQLEAANREDALSLLRKKRLKMSQLTKKPVEIKFTLGTGIKSIDISRFTRQFSVMTSAGLPLIQCLTILQEQSENPAMKEVIHKVAQSISGGSNLSDALGQHPKVFTKLYCHMVSAGEAGGILDSILNRLAEYQENAERLKRKVKKAMMYPIIVMVVAVAVVVVLLTLVVPKFAEIFEQSGNQLPMPTQVVLGVSNLLQDNILLIFLGMIMASIGFAQFLRVPAGRKIFDTFKLKAPGIGNLETRSSIARFARTLGTLLNAGVSVLDALNVTAKTAGNVVLEETILKTQDGISGGKPMAEPLKESGVFPSMVVQMIGVGEKTGQLGTMLIKVADFYDEEVDAAVDALTSMIEPLIIVFLGVVIGAILIAMYMPMFAMTDNIS